MGWAESLIERVLERACERARTESPRAAALLAELSGTRLAISVAGTPFDGQRALLIESDGHLLRLAMPGAPPPSAAAASIRGGALSLLALTRTDAATLIQRGDISIDGDAQIARQYGELGGLLAPDPEQLLSQLIGRSAAHVLMGAARSTAGRAREAAWTSVRNVAEYLAHESGDLVSRAQARHWVHGIEQAREQLDRLEARLTLLERRMRGLAGGSEPA